MRAPGLARWLQSVAPVRARGAVAIAVAWRYRLTFATIVSGLLALHFFDWLL